MFIFYLLWLLILIILFQLILYRPLTPLDIFYDNNEKGTAMTEVGNKLTSTVLIPKDTEKLEILIYNENSSAITCRVLQGEKLLGKKGLICKEGFSTFIVNVRRDFVFSTQCIISLEKSNEKLTDVNLKSVKAWVG
jgi:hypothetical protein